MDWSVGFSFFVCGMAFALVFMHAKNGANTCGMGFEANLHGTSVQAR